MHRSFFPNRRFFARPLDDASSPSSRIVISSRQGENRAPRRMTVHLNEPLKGGPREREPHRAEARSPSRQTNLALTAVKPFRTGSFPVHACRSSTRNTIFVKPEEFLAIDPYSRCYRQWFSENYWMPSNRKASKDGANSAGG